MKPRGVEGGREREKERGREGERQGGKEGRTEEVGPGLDLSVHTGIIPETSINIVFFFTFSL